MEFKKELKRIKKAMIEREKASAPIPFKIPKIEDEAFNNCLCTDSQHRFKALYATETEAKQQAKFLYDEQGIYLVVYSCPTSLGWHLSKG